MPKTTAPAASRARTESGERRAVQDQSTHAFTRVQRRAPLPVGRSRACHARSTPSRLPAIRARRPREAPCCRSAMPKYHRPRDRVPTGSRRSRADRVTPSAFPIPANWASRVPPCSMSSAASCGSAVNDLLSRDRRARTRQPTVDAGERVMPCAVKERERRTAPRRAAIAAADRPSTLFASAGSAPCSTKNSIISHRVVTSDRTDAARCRPAGQPVRIRALLSSRRIPFQIVPVRLPQQQRRHAVGVQPPLSSRIRSTVLLRVSGNVIRRLFVVRVGAPLEEQARHTRDDWAMPAAP